MMRKSSQQSDEWIKAISEILKERKYEQFFEKKSIVYKMVDGRDIMVIPKSMEVELIKKYHNESHFGVVQTEFSLGKQFFVPRLRKKIKNIINSCVRCILSNKKSGKQEGFLQSVDKEDLPLETFHVDHITYLTSKQYKCILLVIDGFSKFVWPYPVKTLTSSEVVKKLTELQVNFENPRRIISDRGTAFTSNEIEEYCKKENIQHSFITTGANGQVERLNRVLKNVLTKVSINSPDKWYKHVPHVQHTLNSSFQRAIQ